MSLLFLNSSDLWISAALIALLAVGAAGYFVITRYREKVAPKKQMQRGSRERGAKVLRKILGSYIRRCEGRVIYSIELAGGKSSGSADAVLIGWFGVLVLVGCDLSGDLYVDDPKAPSLTQVVKAERAKHENPSLLAERAERAVNEILRQKKVYRVQVESAVVFTGRGARPSVPSAVPYFTPETLKKALRAGKYMEDKGVDADKVAEAILSWR